MKDKLREQFEVLKNFLMNIKSIANHPYASGVDVNKLIEDLTDFVNDLEKILDEDDDKEEKAEESKKAE